jgi:hypothetical protein
MQMRNTHGVRNRSEVYVVFRVFDVASDGLSMRVYLDPEQLRLAESLVFTAETWSVVPR